MIQNDGHRKAFTLSPSEPDLGSLILQARDTVVEDNELSLGARLMFVRVLDLSVRQASNVRPGVVTISQMKLAEKFGVSPRTIWTWKDELVRRGHIWMSSQPMPNAWPIDTYHVAMIHAPHNTGDKTSVEGLWGNGTRLRTPLNPASGARRSGLRLAADCDSQESATEKPDVLRETATQPRSELRASAEAGFCPPPKPASGHRRSKLPLAAEAGCDSPPKQIASGSGSQLRRGAEAGCEHKEAKVLGSSRFEGGGKPPAADLERETAFKKWEARLDDMRNSDLRKAEEIAKREFHDARTEPARALGQRKLVAIRLRLRGPVAVETTAPATATSKAKPARTLDDAALLKGARDLIALGKANLISPLGMAALLKNKAGLSPDEWRAIQVLRKGAQPVAA